MRILLIDSATEAFSVSIAKDDRLIADSFFEMPRGHLVNLVPSMDRLLAALKMSFSDISAIAVTNGPGSFTGVRLGVMTARTVAQLCDIPVYPLNTLDVIAMNCLCCEGTICAMLDARKGEIFSALYRREGCSLRKLSGYRVHSPEGLVEDLAALERPVTATGNALARYGALIAGASAEAEKVTAMPSSYWYPRGGSLLRAALDSMSAGRGVSYHEVTAFYMRDSEAEETKRGGTA